uniref:Uncharacterized protein n=1 Tax=Echinostoma caproni TaxID=27848 RepID=A0A183AQT9_9TREM
LISVVETETTLEPQQGGLKSAARVQSQSVSILDGAADFWSANHRAAQRCICVKLDAICALGDYV